MPQTITVKGLSYLVNTALEQQRIVRQCLRISCPFGTWRRHPTRAFPVGGRRQEALSSRDMDVGPPVAKSGSGWSRGDRRCQGAQSEGAREMCLPSQVGETPNPHAKLILPPAWLGQCWGNIWKGRKHLFCTLLSIISKSSLEV